MSQLLLPQASAFGKVVVLYGGTSAEREVSLNSGKAVYDGLLAYGIDAHLLDTGKEDVISALRDGDYARAFIVLHGRGGEDGEIQSILHYLKIPFTGSDMASCAIAMDKLVTKSVWRDAGLPVLPDMQVYADDSYESIAQELRSACFVVKPALEGSSVGVSRVSNQQEFAAAFIAAGGAGEKIMAEPWIDGRELTYTVLGEDVLPSIEIIASGSHVFYDYEAKYLADDTRYLCPAPIEAALDGALREDALAAFLAVGGSGWGRVDYLLDEQGYASLLEVNMVPGMTSHSLVPLAAKEAGLDFTTLVVAILAQTM
ncbi:D-alanine--D-alanine ligase [Suttonella sp. R2A3]|uniref:D-alanine--D-alanine ligase n=1 Tax=Suttonella sp. R2A3 TaxID=2908648 RepID=UPI001F291D07|nr:D-alanine--D-alanine ligase [Suttonella sp. R2A3]UJF24616.1 D-alanine--D-alanine ligase [Suttonella sp. R2A3]